MVGDYLDKFAVLWPLALVGQKIFTVLNTHIFPTLSRIEDPGSMF